MGGAQSGMSSAGLSDAISPNGHKEPYNALLTTSLDKRVGSERGRVSGISLKKHHKSGFPVWITSSTYPNSLSQRTKVLTNEENRMNRILICSLYNVPISIFGYVFSYLPKKDILSLLQASKSFYNVIKSRSFWQSYFPLYMKQRYETLRRNIKIESISAQSFLDFSSSSPEQLEFNVVCIGPESCAKTLWLNAILEDMPFDNVKSFPTEPSSSCESVKINFSVPSKLKRGIINLWVIPGKDSFSSLLNNYLSRSDVVVLMCSTTPKYFLKSCIEMIQSYSPKIKVRNEDIPTKGIPRLGKFCPVLVVGNGTRRNARLEEKEEKEIIEVEEEMIGQIEKIVTKRKFIGYIENDVGSSTECFVSLASIIQFLVDHHVKKSSDSTNVLEKKVEEEEL